MVLYDYNQLEEDIDENISKNLISKYLDFPPFLADINSTILVNLVTNNSFNLFFKRRQNNKKNLSCK